MVTMEASIPKSNPNPVANEGTAKASLYEQSREERIKENLQRMQNLGLLNLAQNLKSETQPVKRRYTRRTDSAQKSPAPLQPSRRSSRLENATPVNYNDGVNEKSKASKRECVVVIGEGARPEIYTEEHEKLLGNTERVWTCFVDGYAKDGKRMHDPFKGKTCHQCRQKTLGHRTHCSGCEMVQGQFCGDCLYMRYGEHVMEALENPDWKCPVCRGICNCSLCRNHKGWVPTGAIYRRIAKLGYKSVAHYLIQTKRAQTDDDDDDSTPSQASAKRSLSFKEAKPLSEIAAGDDNDLSEEVVLMLQNGDSLKKEEDENPNSAKRSLSFVVPSSVDDQAPLVDDLEAPKEDNQERSCAHIGDHSRSEELLPEETQTLLGADVKVLSDETEIGDDDLTEEVEPKLQNDDESTDENPNSAKSSLSFVLPSAVEDQALIVDVVQVISDLEAPKEDNQERSCGDIGDGLSRSEEKTGEGSSYLLPEENQTLLVVDVKVLSDETKTVGNAVKTRGTRNKRKAPPPPSPDSIGARLRQRRRC
ncbi:unnamed protein product [Microthlaspi erraticum]|uniref:Zinc-finger domain-containing protein n=1 Tax=Microthlaspi erraticum TaxID=1685480 RepID=A0A6D2KRQ4_9BRAS|nr:unnamed protein product [Microthlaspi erraticum]CAA7055005.1 unnamed protein product [Microthlaspi erraticum]